MLEFDWRGKVNNALDMLVLTVGLTVNAKVYKNVGLSKLHRFIFIRFFGKGKFRVGLISERKMTAHVNIRI